MVRKRLKKFALLFLLILLIIYLPFNHSSRKTEINNIDINELSPESIYIILFWTKFYLHEYPFVGKTSEGLKCNFKNTLDFINDQKAIAKRFCSCISLV